MINWLRLTNTQTDIVTTRLNRLWADSVKITQEDQKGDVFVMISSIYDAVTSSKPAGSQIFSCWLRNYYKQDLIKHWENSTNTKQAKLKKKYIALWNCVFSCFWPFPNGTNSRWPIEKYVWFNFLSFYILLVQNSARQTIDRYQYKDI